MGRRMYSRQANGRFRRATMENTFGLTIYVCQDCRRMNPAPVGATAGATQRALRLLPG